MKTFVIDNKIFNVIDEKNYKFHYMILERHNKLYFLKENILSNKSYEHAINNEIFILSLLKNKHVSNIVAYKKNKYILYDYINGVTLNKINNFSVKSVLKIILCTIELLIELKSNGYVHCDIKRSNIMIDHDNIYFIDFGSCTLINEKVLFASLNCSSPELLSTKIAKYSNDIYSLGILMYELLTNVTLYKEVTYNEILNQKKNKLKDVNKIRNDVSIKLNKIIMNCLSLNENERYTLEQLKDVLNVIYLNEK